MSAARKLGALHRVLGNAAAVTGFRVAADVALLVFIVVVSRRYGAEGIGVYAYSIAVAAIIFSVPQYALSGLLVAQGSVSTAAFAALWRPVLRLNRIGGALALGIVVAIALLGPEDTRNTLLLVALAQWLYSAGELHRAAFAAHEQSGRIAWSELLYKAAIPVLAVPAMLAGASLEAALIGLPIAGTVYLAAVSSASRRFRTGAVHRARAVALPMRAAARRAAPFFVSIALAAPIYRLQPVVVAAVVGLTASGLYSAAFKPIETGLLLFGAVATALIPVLVRLAAAGERRAHDREFDRACIASLAIAGAGAAAGIALAPWLVPLVFGPEFEAAVPAFRVMCLVLPATALRNLFLAGLTSSGRLRRWTAAQAAGLVAAAASALLLVPPFGLMGAAAGLVIGESLGCAAAGLLWRQGRATFRQAVPATDTTPRSAAFPPRA